jgi:hypothetical protein
VTLEGSVGSADIQDGSIRINHLYSGFLAGAQAASAAASTDLLLLGTSAGTANRSVTVATLLSGMWSSPLLYQQFSDWSADRMIFSTEDGETRAIAPYGLASSLIKQAPLASALGDYAANLVGVNQSSGATAMKIADFAKALIAQAPDYSGTEAFNEADLLLAVDVSSGLVRKIAASTMGRQLVPKVVVTNVPLPTSPEQEYGKTPHNFGKRPYYVTASLVCVTDDAATGWKAGDVVALPNLYTSQGGHERPAIIPVGDPTNVWVTAAAKEAGQINYYISHKVTGLSTELSSTNNWVVDILALG